MSVKRVTYDIYTGRKRNGDLTNTAICRETMQDQPEDYFVPGTTEIHKVGTVIIDGDTHLLGEFFCVDES